MEWYIKVLKSYTDFNGRARRKEYWMFVLFNTIIAMVLGFIDGFTGLFGEVPVLSGLYTLGILLPALAVTVRRLHDTGRSGWWILISFIPVIGGIVIFVFMVLDSEPGENRYGSNPKTAGASF